VQRLTAEDDAVPKERIFAAVGIKVNKAGEEDEHEEATEQERDHPTLPA
jgi:hypothetical protein